LGFDGRFGFTATWRNPLWARVSLAHIRLGTSVFSTFSIKAIRIRCLCILNLEEMRSAVGHSIRPKARPERTSHRNRSASKVLYWRHPPLVSRNERLQVGECSQTSDPVEKLHRTNDMPVQKQFGAKEVEEPLTEIIVPVQTERIRNQHKPHKNQPTRPRGASYSWPASCQQIGVCLWKEYVPPGQPGAGR
jgi:hypothetical protein